MENQWDHPEAIFHQILMDGPNLYLKPISPDYEQFKMNRLEKGDKILAA